MDFQFHTIYNFTKNQILHIWYTQAHVHLHIFTHAHTPLSLCTGIENKVMLQQHKTHNILL